MPDTSLPAPVRLRLWPRRPTRATSTRAGAASGHAHSRSGPRGARDPRQRTCPRGAGRGGGPAARGVPRGGRHRPGRRQESGPEASTRTAASIGLVRPTRWCTRRPQGPRPGRAGAQRPAGRPRARRGQVRLECVVPAGAGAAHHQERHGCPHRPDRVGDEPRRTSGRPGGPACGLGAVDGHVAGSRPAVRPGVGLTTPLSHGDADAHREPGRGAAPPPPPSPTPARARLRSPARPSSRARPHSPARPTAQPDRTAEPDPTAQPDRTAQPDPTTQPDPTAQPDRGPHRPRHGGTATGRVRRPTMPENPPAASRAWRPPVAPGSPARRGRSAGGGPALRRRHTGRGVVRPGHRPPVERVPHPPQRPRRRRLDGRLQDR